MVNNFIETKICIIGGGPAGLFAALKLKEHDIDKFILLEKGKNVNERTCPREKTGVCVHCKPCNITSGIGGAGTNSDGKITLTPEFGGNLNQYYSNNELERYIKIVDNMFVEFGAPENSLFEPDERLKGDLIKKGNIHGIRIVPASYRHLGTDGSKTVISNMYEVIKDHVMTGKNVIDIEVDNFKYLIKTEDGTAIIADKLIIGTGREGSSQLTKCLAKIGVQAKSLAVDLGVRVETSASILKDLTDNFYEVKCIYNTPTYDDRVRTFCMCPHGEVTTEYNETEEILTVNGHSNRYIKTENTNFALLVSKNFTEPFKDPNGYASHIARLANLLSDGGVLIQRLGDLRNGRRSTEARIERGLVKPTLKASPGDLSLVLPHRHLVSILETLEALNNVFPGINNGDTLLYGVEIKLYSNKYEVNKNMKVKDFRNLYIVGDGSGTTRSICQAAISGLIAAEDIINEK